MTVIVKLSKDEVRVCTLLAVERWLAKFGSTDRPNYARGKEEGRLEHELTATIRANVAEWAVAKHYNQAWNVPWYPNELHHQRKLIADVGEEIEVRTIRTKDAIPIWFKDRGKIIVGTKVLDTEHYSEVEIYGYFRAVVDLKDEWLDEQSGAWRIPLGEFKDA